MQRKTFFIISSIVLFALGLAMVIIGVSNNMIPPTLTGIGFWIIAQVIMYLGRSMK